MSINGNQEIIFFQSLNHVDMNLKPRYLIKSGYYIVPSPSTALIGTLFKALFVDFLENEAFLRRVAMVPNGLLTLLTSKMSKKEDNPDWKPFLDRAGQTPRGAFATPVFW